MSFVVVISVNCEGLGLVPIKKHVYCPSGRNDKTVKNG